MKDLKCPYCGSQLSMDAEEYSIDCANTSECGAMWMADGEGYRESKMGDNS
jgi:hypothetical protein